MQLGQFPENIGHPSVKGFVAYVGSFGRPRAQQITTHASTALQKC